MASPMHAAPWMRSTFGLALALVLVALGTRDARAAEGAAGCEAEDVEYLLSARLHITGTILGAGDGDHVVGPGRLVLQFSQKPEPRGGSTPVIRMTQFELRQRFTVVSKVVFFATSILSDIDTRAVPDTRSVVAEGFLDRGLLRWTRVPGVVRDDGTLLCSGSFCGKFGAPPNGRSEYHAGPEVMRFAAFRFSDDMKTFTMAPVLASKTDDPKQETYLTFAGREVKRACAREAP